MIQEIKRNEGQVTQNGHIINCHAGEECLLRKGQEPESIRQAEFAETTGIWCPKEAREQLERLMDEDGFTVRELYSAWRADNLNWNREQGSLVVRVYWFEALFGYGSFGLMLLYYILQVGQIMLTGSEMGWRGFLAFLAASIIYLGLAYTVGRFMLWPRRVAIRVNQAISLATD